MKSPLVSVIIVSYNTRALTLRCLQHVFLSQGFKASELEVIVVDNHSTDDTVLSLKKSYPKVKLVVNKINRGYGAGNNQGVKVARGEYLLFLNTDAYLAPESLRRLLDRISGDPSILAVGPQLKFAGGRLQPSAGYLPTPWRVLAWMTWLDKLPLLKLLVPRPYHIFHQAWYQTEHTPDWLMGACLMLRRADFLKSGGFDERIFMYAEEVELFQRLHFHKNRRVVYTPSTTVTHLGSASSGQAQVKHLVLELRGIEHLYRLHFPRLSSPLKAIISLGVGLRIVIFSLLPSKRPLVREYLSYYQ